MRIPSTSNPAAGVGGAQGTMGGQPRTAVGARPGARAMNMGEEVYLWILVLIELMAIGFLRNHFRRHHGG